MEGEHMEKRDLQKLLEAVAAGEQTVEQAVAKLNVEPFSDLGFAKVDHHRGIRQGVSEVIYGEGKTPDQIAGIVANMLDRGQERILITRIGAQAAQEVEQLLSEGLSYGVEGDEADAAGTSLESVKGEKAANEGALGATGADVPMFGAEEGAEDDVEAEAADVPELPVFTYYDVPRVATVGEAPEPDGAGAIIVACGGTSDLYVAEEAALTAEMLGNQVIRLYDVGVAGLHRLLAHQEELASARVVVAVAGMEGALASVIGGLVSCPVIAVPTSVGYGASLGGLSALLAMLNSCASGVSVVNIDNGFGAGYQASLINHL